MAYNSYFPVSYAPMQQTVQPMPSQPVQSQPAQQSSSLTWVQGEAGAKSFMVAPNSTVLLMDSEADRFYLKSSDASGMPSPLRIFEYKELSAQDNISSQFATKDDVEALRAKIDDFIKEYGFDEQPLSITK